MVQLSHLYMATGKTIALTRWTIVSTVMFVHATKIHVTHFIVMFALLWWPGTEPAMSPRCAYS